MAHVVCEGCINCKRTDCVDVCPVDCFREGPNFVVIDPDECIDCAVCVPECIELNRELSHQWPSITRKKPCPDDADQWRDVKGKIKFLKR